MSRDAIISIRPHYVDAIFSGAKTVELRRRIPTLNVGTRLWIYSTLPVGALVGSAEIRSIAKGTPDDSWKLHQSDVGVCRAQFEAYYEESNIAYGLSLANVRNGHPVGIETLRKIRPKFHPPQVMSYVTDDEAYTLYWHLFGIKSDGCTAGLE